MVIQYIIWILTGVITGLITFYKWYFRVALLGNRGFMYSTIQDIKVADEQYRKKSIKGSTVVRSVSNFRFYSFIAVVFLATMSINIAFGILSAIYMFVTYDD